eukprot:TRINITY_DN942_c0_g1_i6.p1 TRINITY_DN942_c0_g1~~TRINITY_DN942_c0_g1_i6.p1  ORF type:complete len:659 (-),score=167.73 TRINITY_DN942_c0_g1_i6:275-2251(-)
MGSICSKRSAVDYQKNESNNSPGNSIDGNAHGKTSDKQLPDEGIQSSSFSSNIPFTNTANTKIENMEKERQEDISWSNQGMLIHEFMHPIIVDEPDFLSRSPSYGGSSAKSKSTTVAKIGATKVSEMGSLLGRAGTAGLGKAVEVLDTLGSSVTSLNLHGGFSSGVTTKGNKIDILAFEVANTIVKGANLKNSLSEDNMRILKEEILLSEGVQKLVSNDMDELLRLAALDKRKELKVFAREVVRFGNHCKDPQWHQLDRYFEKLGTEVPIHKQSNEEAEALMQQLMTLAQHTAELYHEMHALDRFEQDYRRKIQEEESLNVPNKDGLALMRSDLKSQRKHVRNLRKKSLWSKNLEEVMEKLVDMVSFLHQEIEDKFRGNDIESENKNRLRGSPQRLGPAGLALHYANLINQIDSLVSRPGSVPPNTRDTLYRGLPPSIKTALRCKLQSSSEKEEYTIPQIKAEMEKILHWLVPVAANTTKAHHGFGWVGEWANTGSAMDRRVPGHHDLTLIQTLNYAEKEKTESYIFELIVWLHHLVNQSRVTNGNKSPIKSPVRSPGKKTSNCLQQVSDKIPLTKTESAKLPTNISQEDKELLNHVNLRKLTPGLSKSQEFDTSKKRSPILCRRLSRSNSHSSTANTETDSLEIVSHLPSSLVCVAG